MNIYIRMSTNNKTGGKKTTAKKTTAKKTGGGEPKGFKGRRRPLKKPLKEASKKTGKASLEQFYCLTCKQKRISVNIKNITLRKTKNGRDQAVAKCSKAKCQRKLYKFISKADADRLRKLKK